MRSVAIQRLDEADLGGHDALSRIGSIGRTTGDMSSLSAAEEEYSTFEARGIVVEFQVGVGVGVGRWCW